MQHSLSSLLALICSCFLLAACSRESDQILPKAANGSQNGIFDDTGGATQNSNGHGVYIQKHEREVCLGNWFNGLDGGNGCSPMRQTKWMITPSGKATSVWEGDIPSGAVLPAEQPYHCAYLAPESNVEYDVTTTYSSQGTSMKTTFSYK